MKTRVMKKMMVIVLSVFTGSFLLLAMAASGDRPEGKPFDALWGAINDLYSQVAWTISGDNMWSAVDGNVGIGTNGPAYKKLEVVGDSMFTNPDNNTYFFIESGQGVPIPTDGKRIGAYDDGVGWKTLGVDGTPLVLNGRSGGLIQVNGPINLYPMSEPATPGSGFVLYVDVVDGNLKAKSSSGSISTLANH